MDLCLSWAFSFLKDETIESSVNFVNWYLVWIDDIFTLEKEAIFISRTLDKIIDRVRYNTAIWKIKLTSSDIFVDSPQVEAKSSADMKQKYVRPLIGKRPTDSPPAQNDIVSD